MTPLYDGPDRRRTVQDRFEEAVELASTRAAQRVAHIHRWRLVRWTFLAALLCALGAVLILWFTWIGPQERAFSRRNAIYDCQLFASNAAIMADFIETDADLRAKQESLSNKQEVLSGYNKIFGKGEVGKLLGESHKIDHKAIDHWRNVDVPMLTKNSLIDCTKFLGG